MTPAPPEGQDNVPFDAELDGDITGEVTAHKGVRTLTVSRELRKRVFVTVLAVVFALITVRSVLANHLRDTWQSGDWMINYHGGFIRRGLTGEIAVLTQIPRVAVAVMQIGAYLILFYLLVRIVRTLNYHSAVLFTIISPAFLLFYINGTKAALKKEVLLSALLAYCTDRYLSADLAKQRKAMFISFALITPIILTHEALALGLPTLLAIWWPLHKKISWTDKAVVIGLCLIACTAFVLSLLYGAASPEEWAKMCQPIIEYCDPELGWNTALKAVTWDEELNHFNNMLHMSTMRNVALIASVAVLDATCAWFAGSSNITNPHSLRAGLNVDKIGKIEWLLHTVTIAGLTYIITIAVDWGRFVHIGYSSIILFLFSRTTAKQTSETQISRVSFMLAIIAIFVWKLERIDTFKFFWQ